MKLRTAILSALLCTTSYSASAEQAALCAYGVTPGWYAQVSGSGVMPIDDKVSNKSTGILAGIPFEDDKGAGVAVAIAGGYKFENNIRLELEQRYERTKSKISAGNPVVYTDSATNSSYITMLNTYLDIPTGTQFTPYIGAGAGVSYLDAGCTKPITGQGMLGTSYVIDSDISALFGYRYSATVPSKCDIGGGDVIKERVRSHNLDIGLRYHFN